MVNDADISQPPSALLSMAFPAPSTHPLGLPFCESCQVMGLEAECSYSSAVLTFTENKSTENRITKKTGAPFSFSEPMSSNASALPAIGYKRPRAADSSSEPTEIINAVVGLPTQNDSSHAQETQMPQQPPTKRHKTSELGPGSPDRQSALQRDQVTPAGTGMSSGSELQLPPRLRNISPTLHEDETELRCNLTTEINLQRTRHRNLAAGALRSIIQLLKKAKIERSNIQPASTEPTSSQLEDVELDVEWREQDDLMESAFTKLDKGGRCSRPLLSRFENFLYGPLMSPEERKMQERIICVEECLSSILAAPTSNRNHVFLHRLKKIILNPDVYGLDENDPRIGFLRNEVLTAISTKSRLTRAHCRKFVELLDPDGEMVNANLNSPGVKAETPTLTGKVPPRPTSPRVPSSNTPGTPSRTLNRKQSSFASLSPSPSHPPLSSSRSSSLSTPLESIDLTEDTMSFHLTATTRKITKRVVSGSQSSQFNDTMASPVVQSATKKRPGPDSQSNDIISPSPKRAVSGTQSSNSNNALVPTPNRITSGSQPLSFETPKKLWNIFMKKQAALMPILNLDQLKAAFALAVNHGKITLTAIDPTFGLCIAIACHLTRNVDLGEGRKWYDAALSNQGEPLNARPSLKFFQHQILQIHYLHMAGHLKMAWDILSLAISRAQSLQMHTTHGGCLALDEESLEQVRLVWQYLWTKKISLSLQFGIVYQSLDTFDESPMPMQSHITENMGVSGMQTTEQSHATPSFFIACVSLFKFTDDLITVENDLRVTRMECPIKWLSIVDLRGFQELNEKLSSWKDGLPKILEWRGHGIDFTMQKDLVIRRMCLLAHMRFMYFRLRQHRPFFILSLRLSQMCACETSPHLTSKGVDSVDASPVLGLVYYSAIKCLTAAQDIVKCLCASFADAGDEDAKCEQLEYLYAAGTILIAARTAPLLVNGTWYGLPSAAATAKSLTTMTEELKEIDILLRNYQGSCQQAPKLKRRIERVRVVLDQLSLQSVSSSGIVTDNEITFEPVIWNRIYDRLRLDVPFERFPGNSQSGVVGRRKTLGWLESLPIDIYIEN
ncbi:hypothetical protein PENVUL_c025G05508 [Penicillium vulpinum]|uniref:Transcription factor domain-containing protein n=1 Tax=Penicillium vulpinum TaxID=29845 RepID=A0A1V6RUA3_9EURO|nr:hypothetical protein PENVUL_c025G05508 [Penicillium vulpinum]